MGTVIAVTNLKGGVGKTSTCFHLGGILASRGLRVLLVDDDPQSSLTQVVFGPRFLRSVRPEETMHAVFASNPYLTQIVRPTGFPCLDLIPGHLGTDEWNMVQPPQWHLHENSIREIVDEARESYDRIIIDTPPNLYLLTHSALVAADWALVPVQPEDFGAQGLSQVNRALSRAQEVSGGPALLGYIVSMFDKRLNVHKAYRKGLQDTYGDLVFDTPLPQSKSFKNAVTERCPVSELSDKTAKAKAENEAAIKAVSRLADEIESRIEGAGRAAA